MNAAAEQTSYTPIFNWDAPRDRRLLLGGFIVASAILHALCFYVFQIIYPPIVALLPPPVRISVINGSTEEGRLLLQWIEAEDPALAATTVRPPAAEQLALPKTEYVPSFANREPQLQPVPRYQPDLRVPSAQPPAPVPMPRHAAPTPAPVAATTITFSAAGDLLPGAQLPPLEFSTSSKEQPAAAQFRIGIDRRGAVKYCFLERSSGDALLDEQARHVLLLTRFPEIETRSASGGSEIENLWLTATIHWGSDIHSPTP